MKTIYNKDDIIVTQQNDLTYYMQINDTQKISNDSSSLIAAISAIRNAVWALDTYSSKKIQLSIALLGSIPNATIMQTNPNNSQLKNVIVLTLDITVNFSMSVLAQQVLTGGIVGAGIGFLAGFEVPIVANAGGAVSGFIAGAGRVLFLAGVGYFSTTLISNAYDTLKIDDLYDYLKENVFNKQDSYAKQTLRNPNNKELYELLKDIDNNRLNLT